MVLTWVYTNEIKDIVPSAKNNWSFFINEFKEDGVVLEVYGVDEDYKTYKIMLVDYESFYNENGFAD